MPKYNSSHSVLLIKSRTGRISRTHAQGKQLKLGQLQVCTSTDG